MYHISDVKKFNRCKRLFQQSLNDNDTSFNLFARRDKDITDLAIKKLKIDHYFKGEVNDDKSLALQALNNYEWLIKARFEFGGLRVKVPFLNRVDNKWNLYFLYIGNYPHEDDKLFYSAIVWVLENCGVVLNDLFIIHLNSRYIRDEELDVEELFIISDCFYNQNNNKGKKLNEVLLDKKNNYINIIDDMNFYSKSILVSPVKVKACNKFGKCKYYDDCFKDELLDNNSLLTLVGSQFKNTMYWEGLKTLKEVNIEKIEGSRKQYAQIKADINGGLFYDKIALMNWKKKLIFPLIFLDFEWETFAIPPYKGMKPYDVLPFQYSVHIFDGENMIHREFVGINDTRLKFIMNLLSDIPPKGSIIAYNAEAAEKIRLKELSDYFNDKRIEIERIIDRMVDLQFPFEAGLVYDTRMKGQYSLKTIMNFLDENAYKTLDINQGMDAVYSWRKIDKELTEDKKEVILEKLKAYCSMDTYAMFKVYKWLDTLWQN